MSLVLVALGVACADQATEVPVDQQPVQAAGMARAPGMTAHATASSDDGLTISTDKDDYQPGDTVYLHVTPGAGGYDPDDVKIIEAIARFRAGGYDEAIGFTVYDTLRYRNALQPLVEEEVRVLIERLSGEVDPDAAVEIMRSGREPLRDLIGAMHSKLLLAEFQRQQ
jgi:hypothetical protein